MFPILHRHNVKLRYRGRKNRRAQLLVLDAPFGPVRLVNWHLGLSDAERQWQVACLLAHARYRAYDKLPTLIAGDFNDWRNTLQGAALAQHALTQVTLPLSRFRTFPAYMPVGGLDKAFRCNRLKVETARVVKSRLTRRASDHLPLVIDLELA
jgi:endonuclease/exonuclease/phosphatase family metal-dependent hydrolase